MPTPIISFIANNIPVHLYVESVDELIPIEGEVHVSLINANGSCFHVSCRACPLVTTGCTSVPQILIAIKKYLPEAVNLYPHLFI